MTSSNRLLAVGVLASGCFTLATGCAADKVAADPPPTSTLYIESNALSGNSVLEYKRGTDGTLTASGQYDTGGAGSPNPGQLLGPQDNDKPMVVAADGKTLFAVNSGSNSISAFTVGSDGALAALKIVPSGGIDPVSAGLAGDRLYVVNKAQDPGQTTTGAVPNYTAFSVSGSTLTPLAGTTYSTAASSSPSVAQPSRDGKFLFGTDFLAFMSGLGTLRSFAIGGDGALTAVTGTPQTVPPGADPTNGGALGLWQHPSQNILYVGYPMEAAVGVYNIDPSSGALSFVTEVSAGRAACWLRTDPAGRWLYALNSADGAVQVFDLTNPLTPMSLQVFALKSAGPLYDAGPPLGMTPTSQPFHEEVSKDGAYLYVLSQHTNPDATATNGNVLHTLKIGADGTLSEPSEPTPTGVAPPNRPQGIVLY